VNNSAGVNAPHASATVIETAKPWWDSFGNVGGRSPTRSRLSHAFAQPHARLLLGALFLFALVIVVYLPILPGSFVMDDARLVGKAANPLVNGSLTLRSVWFQTDFPLTLCAWWAEWSMWGENAFGYHAVNLLLQAFSAVFLWRVLVRLNVPGAWLAAAIFAVHPVCVGSVARIAELKNTLSLPFFLVSVWAYLHYEANSLYRHDKSVVVPNYRGTSWFCLSFIAFILALFSKTTTIALPVTLLGCAAWQRGRVSRRDLAHTVPFFVLSVSFGLMSVWFQKYQALAGMVLPPQSFGERLGVGGRNFWFYCGKALLPINLTVFYPRWKTDVSALMNFLPVLLMVGVFVACWFFRRSWGKPALFGLGCFTILLFPALGFFDAQCFVKFQVSDHLQYLPLIALVSLVAGAIGSLPDKRTFQLSAIILISILSILSFKRAQVFSTQESLLRDTLAKNPAAWAVHNDLGVILVNQGKFSAAAEQFKTALEGMPNDPDLLANLALTDFVLGRLNESCAEYCAALRIKPDSAALHEGLADVLKCLGRNDEAIAHLTIALRISSKTETHANLAELLFMRGDFRRAVDHYRHVLLVEPDNVACLNNLAYVLIACPDRSIRDGGEAIKLSERACQLTSFKQPPFLKTLSAAYAAEGRLAEATAATEMISRLQVAAAEPLPASKKVRN
jgi:protein O-mannosyl-transferase